MESLYTQNGKQQIIDRINKLNPNAKALWGIMTVDQMLKHCQLPMELALEKRTIKGNKLISFLFGKSILKQYLAQGVELKKNSPTFKEAKNLSTNGFEVEKNALIEIINQFNKEKISTNPHPFFGKLTIDNWDVLQQKHLDHHLRQFGA